MLTIGDCLQLLHIYAYAQQVGPPRDLLKSDADTALAEFVREFLTRGESSPDAATVVKRLEKVISFAKALGAEACVRAGQDPCVPALVDEVTRWLRAMDGAKREAVLESMLLGGYDRDVVRLGEQQRYRWQSSAPSREALGRATYEFHHSLWKERKFLTEASQDFEEVLAAKLEGLERLAHLDSEARRKSLAHLMLKAVREGQRSSARPGLSAGQMALKKQVEIACRHLEKYVVLKSCGGDWPRGGRGAGPQVPAGRPSEPAWAERLMDEILPRAAALFRIMGRRGKTKRRRVADLIMTAFEGCAVETAKTKVIQYAVNECRERAQEALDELKKTQKEEVRKVGVWLEAIIAGMKHLQKHQDWDAVTEPVRVAKWPQEVEAVAHWGCLVKELDTCWRANRRRAAFRTLNSLPVLIQAVRAWNAAVRAALEWVCDRSDGTKRPYKVPKSLILYTGDEAGSSPPENVSPDGTDPDGKNGQKSEDDMKETARENASKMREYSREDEQKLFQKWYNENAAGVRKALEGIAGEGVDEPLEAGHDLMSDLEVFCLDVDECVHQKRRGWLRDELVSKAKAIVRKLGWLIEDCDEAASYAPAQGQRLQHLAEAARKAVRNAIGLAFGYRLSAGEWQRGQKTRRGGKWRRGLARLVGPWHSGDLQTVLDRPGERGGRDEDIEPASDEPDSRDGLHDLDVYLPGWYLYARRTVGDAAGEGPGWERVLLWLDDMLEPL